MRDLATAWRIARRDLHGGLKAFVVFLASLALGVAAIVAVGNLGEGVERALARDARALLGGDLELQVSNLPMAREEVQALVPAARELSLSTRTSTLAEAPNGRRVAVSLKAVDEHWPLYGTVGLEPAMPIAEALGNGGAVVEAALLARLDIGIGDRLRIGTTDVELRAVLAREPDRLGGFLSLGPRVIVSQETLAAAGILQPGALAEFEWRAALPPGLDGIALVTALRAEHPEARWRARAFDEVQPRVERFTDRLGTYLTLAGLTALLIGGVGIGLAIEGYLRARTAAIATMRCVGATSGQIFAIYLIQVLALALLGVAAGVLLGELLPLLLLLVPEGLLPVRPELGIYPKPLLTAAAAGLLTATAFAVWPLALAREVSPASLFRSLVAAERRFPRPRYIAVVGAALAALALLAVLAAPQAHVAGWFVLIAAGSAVLLAGLARLLLLGVARLARRGGAGLRLPLANLHRPGSGAASVVIAVGAGLAVLTLVGLLQANLHQEIDARVSERAPAYVLIDIQPAQREAFHRILAGFPEAAILQEAPTLRGRVVRIAATAADDAAVAENVQWTLRRDRGLSWRAGMPEGTQLVAGEWWPTDYDGPPLVSVEDEVATGYGVGVGDTLGFNVLGRVVEARIANLRQNIDWGSGRLDFVFILSPNAIEGAPHTWIAAVDLPAEQGPLLVDALATELPNVTPLEVGELARRVEETLDRIALAIRIVAAVTLLSGALVLAGAVGAARRRHRFQAVMLKVLGARRADVMRSFLVEYTALGLAAATAGVIIGTLAAWGVVIWLFQMIFVPAPLTIAAVVGLALLLGLVAGVVGLWRSLGQPAATVLRSP
jgi:putative ABC transport system permease protein